MAKRMTKGTTQTGTATTARMTKTTKKRTTSSVPHGALSQVSLSLSDLPEKPKETWSLREVVEQLQSPLSIALQRGYSYEEIVKILADCDIHITASSLKRYLSIAKRTNSTAKLRRTRTPKSETVQNSISQPEMIAASPSELVVEMSPRRRRGRTATATKGLETAKTSKTAQATKTAAKTKATPRTTAARKRSK